MPVWHASLSLRDPAGTLLASPGLMQRHAVRLLADVGGDHEWWIWNPAARVAHLRVPLTAVEYTEVPDGCATGDAGPAGPRRPRTR